MPYNISNIAAFTWLAVYMNEMSAFVLHLHNTIFQREQNFLFGNSSIDASFAARMKALTKIVKNMIIMMIPFLILWPSWLAFPM